MHIRNQESSNIRRTDKRNCAMTWFSLVTFCITHGSGLLLISSYAYGNSANGFKQNGTGFYVVKQRDTLSEVLGSLGLVPIYGKRGTLRQLLQCGQFEKNGDLIRPGQKVFFAYEAGESDAPSARDGHRESRITDSSIEISEESIKAPIKSKASGQCSTLVVTIGLKRNIASDSRAMSSTHSSATSNQQLSDSSTEKSKSRLESVPFDESAADDSAFYSRDVGSSNVDSRKQSRSTFTFELMQGFSRLDLQTSVGGYSELLSKPFVGFKLDWREQIHRSLSVDLLVSKFKIPPSEPSGVAVQGDADFSEIGLGLLWQTSDESSFSVGPLFKYQTQPISTRIGGGIIRVDSPQVLIGGAQAEHLLQFDQHRRLKTNFSLWYAPYSSQSDFSISNGYGFTTDIRLVRQVMRNWDLSGGFSYNFSTFKSSLGDHSRQDLILGLGFIYRFDGQASTGKSIGSNKYDVPMSQKGDRP